MRRAALSGGAQRRHRGLEHAERGGARHRAGALERVSRSREAKVEMQPAFLPRVVREASVPLADLGIAFLRRKYGLDAASAPAAEATLVRELEGLRAALAAGDGEHLLDARFSYADIAMAVTLQLVRPPSEEFLVLGPATREASTAPALAARFADLLAWRDALYARYRAGADQSRA